MMNVPLLLLVIGAAAVLIIYGSASTDSWAAQLAARINPYQDESGFEMKYVTTMHILYGDGGAVADELRGMNVAVSGSADSATDADVMHLAARLNDRIAASGSQARISDVVVDYVFELAGGPERATVEYQVSMKGTLSEHIIARDGQRMPEGLAWMARQGQGQTAVVDLGWRAMTIDDSVAIGGQEINNPLAFVQQHAPRTHDIIMGTDAERLFDEHIINSDRLLEVPLAKWRFLFDPTGIGSGADRHLHEETPAFVVSEWHMDKRTPVGGQEAEQAVQEVLAADRQYSVVRIQHPDVASIRIVGFGLIGSLDGVESAGVMPAPPEAVDTHPVDRFPLIGILTAAGIALVAIVFLLFFAIRRLVKRRR